MAARAKTSKSIPPKTPAAPGGPTPADLATFVAFSAVLTGFSRIELEETGVASLHLNALLQKVGAEITQEVLAGAKQALEQADPVAAIQSGIWKSPKLGPVVQNLVALWYIGSWQPLPKQWLEQYRWDQPDLSTGPEWISPPQPYEEALVWRAIYAHPPGAKPTGFASWADVPVDAPKPLVAITAAGGKQ
jgi:hypothetical protein